MFGGAVDLDLTEKFNCYNGEKWLYSDAPIHTTKYGNEIIVDTLISNIIKPVYEATKEIDDKSILHMGTLQMTYEETQELNGYIEAVKKHAVTNGVIGACVVTCNPFTKGHRYLIEYAAKQVNWLYVFVVEEDAFYFSFEERLEMVQRGTIDLGNVIVVPGGRFMISNETFKNYFEKEVNSNVIIDATKDVFLFKNHVAPSLNIVKRYIGEEPNDYITAQYNDTLKKNLSDIMEVVEISRKKECGEVISASRVRKLVEENNWEEVKRLVPNTTFSYMRNLGKDRKKKRQGTRNDMERVIDFINDHQEIVICGLGNEGQRLMKELELSFPEIDSLVYYDKKLAEEHAKYFGKKVIDFSELIEVYKDYYMIITTSKYRGELFCDLVDHGVVPEHIIVWG